MGLLKRFKRVYSIRSGGSGVPARIDNSQRGEAVFIDSFLGSYGVPVSVEGRESPEGWKGRDEINVSRETRKRLEYASHIRLFSVGYLVILGVVGVVWQWVI